MSFYPDMRLIDFLRRLAYIRQKSPLGCVPGTRGAGQSPRGTKSDCYPLSPDRRAEDSYATAAAMSAEG